jgi:hypothetical protein
MRSLWRHLDDTALGKHLIGMLERGFENECRKILVRRLGGTLE